MFTRLQQFVGTRAGAVILKGAVIRVKPPVSLIDDIESAINASEFTLRLDDGDTVVLPGTLLDVLDRNAYLLPSDCPWIENPAG